MQPRLLEHVRTHHQVRVPVAARVRAVRADPADLGGEMEDELRHGVVEHPSRVLHRCEVVVGAPGDDHVVPVPLEPLDEMRSEEAPSYRDEDAHAQQRILTPGVRRAMGQRRACG